MEYPSTTTDIRTLGEPRNHNNGDQGDIQEETEVCPTCKGKGSLPKSRQGSHQIRGLSGSKVKAVPSAFSESAISTIRNLIRPKVARYPTMHLPSLDEDFNMKDTTALAIVQPITNELDIHVERCIRRAVLKLNGSEWDVKKKGLEECLQISEDHPDEIELYMNQIYRTMRSLLTNHHLRDTIFVCNVARRFFARLRSTCRPEFDQLVIALLIRTADSSFNVRCYVNDALDKMVTYMPTLYALRPLVDKGCKHKNPLVRTSTLRLLSDIVTFRTPSALLTYPHLREACQKIIVNGAILLVDNSLGTRAAAKNLFLKFVNHEEFDRIYEACNVNGELKKRIDRTISALKEQNEVEG